MLPNGDREEALHWGDTVTGQISIGYSWIFAQMIIGLISLAGWDSGFDRETDHVEMHAKGVRDLR